MFGYLNIEKAKLQQDKQGVWQTFMCGMCFSTKRQFGNVPRLFISNDVNFFNVLFHAVLHMDVSVEQHRCASSIKKRPILHQTPLIDALSAANVLLTYWNLYDDIVDGGSLKKKVAFKALGRAYRKAKTIFPQLDAMLSDRYNELRRMEQSNVRSIDAVCHSFAELSRSFAELTLQRCADSNTAVDENVLTLCYNLGKWIYLIDALDDAPKDAKSGNYNPFLACYGFSDGMQLSQKYDEICFLMFAVLNRVAMCYNDLDLGMYGCILQNVLFDSIRDKTNEVLARYRTPKLPQPAETTAPNTPL